MSEPNVVLTLRRKRDDVETVIVSYEKREECGAADAIAAKLVHALTMQAERTPRG